jgi:hypothetical protein
MILRCLFRTETLALNDVRLDAERAQSGDTAESALPRPSMEGGGASQNESPNTEKGTLGDE